ncbi:hypothetical protein PoB_007418700 [Plakobranchus ocellatus]|uniref:Uncharacterized protein n=1 Tax=Plakobranchus ocellatus TaxID=259542 RepID=A0AAV4DTJ5_9GAST|nr:hypothetical protein PoB_007418700 [Plakobranchus ocellatus]
MLKLLTFALLACSAWAATTPMMMMTTEAIPTKPCCTPRRWQAAMYNLKAGRSSLQYATVYVFDADMKKEGYMVLPVDGGSPVYQGFTDYNTGIKYTLTFGPNGGCKQEKADHEFYDHCFGTSIMYDAWSFSIDKMDITISLGRDGCIPILENIVYNDPNMPSETLLLFNDVTTMVTDAHLLDMPRACANAGSSSNIG